MLGKTHSTGGTLTGLVWIGLAGTTNPIAAVTMVGSCAVGSLLPDIDTGQSTISHKIPFGTVLGGVLNRVFGHRGAVHSLIACAIFGIIGFLLTLMCAEGLNKLIELIGFNVLIPKSLYYARLVGTGFALGAANHILYDTFNGAGTRPFWPIKLRLCFAPITTSSPLELFFFYPISIFLNLVALFWLLKIGVIGEMIKIPLTF